jgi:predicted Zn-dependent protease
MGQFGRMRGDKGRPQGIHNQRRPQFPRLGAGEPTSFSVEDFPVLGREPAESDKGMALQEVQSRGPWRRILPALTVLFPILLVVGLAASALRDSSDAAGTGTAQAAYIDCVGDACFEIDPGVASFYADPLACNVPDKIVCLVPTGRTPATLLESIAGSLEDRLGIRVEILPPLPLAADGMNDERHQYSSDRIADYVRSTYRNRVGNAGTLLVAITPVDIYTPQRESWRFAFGTFHQHPSVTTGVVSTARLGVSARTIASRTQKMVNKYVGMAYYNLALSSDPESALYNNILSVRDLDRMSDELPIDR